MVGGQTLCGRDAAKVVGIPESIIYKRLKQGMPPEEALTKPPKKRFKLLTFQGETLPAKEWAKRMGIGCYTFYRRLDAGWPIEKALTTPVRNKSGSYKEWNNANKSIEP